MQDGRVNHDAIIVEIPHEAKRLEIEDFECAIFTSCEKPLVILLELNSGDIARVALLLAGQVDD